MEALKNYWDKRAEQIGHTGWLNSVIYLYDQEVRLRVIERIVEKSVGGGERHTN